MTDIAEELRSPYTQDQSRRVGLEYQAAAEIERLQEKCDELYSDKERWYRMCELHTTNLQSLKELLAEARDDLRELEVEHSKLLVDEIERLKAQNTRLAGRIGCGCGGDYGLCNECAAALAGKEDI
jgi:mevalonate kinase